MSKKRKPARPGHPIWALANTAVLSIFALCVIFIAQDKLSRDDVLLIVGLAVTGWPIWEVGKRLYRGGAER